MTGTREDRPAAEGERCPAPSAQLAPVRIQHLAPAPEIAPGQRVRGRGLIVSHPVARGAERACAGGDARYAPKMIMGSCAAVVEWPGPDETERDAGRCRAGHSESPGWWLRGCAAWPRLAVRRSTWRRPQLDADAMPWRPHPCSQLRSGPSVRTQGL